MIQKVSICLTLIIICVNVLSQTNVNPDPNGEPWIIGPGNYLGDPSDTVIIDPESLTLLPNYVDNSQQDFFYEIFKSGKL